MAEFFTPVAFSTYIAYQFRYNLIPLQQQWAAAWDFQQCGMCNQQSLRSAGAYAQSDQSLC